MSPLRKAKVHRKDTDPELEWTNLSGLLQPRLSCYDPFQSGFQRMADSASPLLSFLFGSSSLAGSCGVGLVGQCQNVTILQVVLPSVPFALACAKSGYRRNAVPQPSQISKLYNQPL